MLKDTCIHSPILKYSQSVKLYNIVQLYLMYSVWQQLIRYESVKDQAVLHLLLVYGNYQPLAPFLVGTTLTKLK